jgi:hypothetical protein
MGNVVDIAATCCSGRPPTDIHQATTPPPHKLIQFHIHPSTLSHRSFAPPTLLSNPDPPAPQRELAKKLVKSAAELPMCNAAYAGDAVSVSQLLQSGKGNAKEVGTPSIRCPDAA